jgi:hypothetical protein
MSKKNKIILVAALVVTAALAFIGIRLFMNINEEVAVTVEQTITTAEPLASDEVPSPPAASFLVSNFVDGDAIHFGSGSARITDTTAGPILTFGEDFKVTNGPDLLVYLSLNGADEDLGNFASLGPLKSTSGAQSYNVPEDIAKYKTVVIWCRAVGVTFATAQISQQ